MGDMADYYDDRNDPVEVYHSQTDQWLPRGDPRLPKPRRSNAWNGHLPTRKAHTMGLTPKAKVRKLEAELDSNLTLQQALRKEEAALRQDIKLADRPEPTPSMGTKWWISVMFKAGGHEYDFLILRVGQTYYTTGTNNSGVFPSWEAFVAWLDSETIYHSAMVPLNTTSGTIALKVKPPTQAPF